MDVNDRLYVEIHPLETPHSPHPHPVRDGHFDPEYVYKVLGVYNPSETSECYFMLANPERQIWFIPQRHLLAHRLIDSDEFFLPKTPAVPPGRRPLLAESARPATTNGDSQAAGLASNRP